MTDDGQGAPIEPARRFEDAAANSAGEKLSVHATQPHVVIVSGLSGAGKTTASKLLEDAGYNVVDNLPVELLRRLAQLVAHDSERFERLALVLDARTGNAPVAFAAAVEALEARGIAPTVIFLEARDDILIRRFSETRHRHPLESTAGVAASVAASVTRERELLDDIRNQADVIIDTSDLSSRQLRERIHAALGAETTGDGIGIHLISFGYKYGVPLEADLVFDVRFMENPFYIDDLRPHSGQTEKVRDFVLKQPQTQRFLRFMREFLEFALPAYQAEGKTRLTIGIGCTGGYHRSIAIAEAIAEGLRQNGMAPVAVWHRELERE